VVVDRRDDLRLPVLVNERELLGKVDFLRHVSPPVCDGCRRGYDRSFLFRRER